METYQAVLAKISKLQEKADQLRRTEIKDVVRRIREAINHYALTAADLGFTDTAAKKRGRKPGAKSASVSPKAGTSKGVPKYRDPQTGKTWTGRGKPPNWIAGVASRDAFLIEAADAAAPTAPKLRRASASTKLPKTSRGAGARKSRRNAAAGNPTAPAAEGTAG